MSTLSQERPTRSDARRNATRILAATAQLLATDAGVGLERVAAHAGVSRATLYHHFPGRDALLDALTEQSVTEVTAAIKAAHPRQGPAPEALERVLRATWPVIGRYRGLMIVNPRRLEPADLRARLDPALRPLRVLIRRGQRSGEFDPELPVEWLIGVITDLVHAAGRQVTTAAMTPREAERVLLRTVAGALSGGT